MTSNKTHKITKQRLTVAQILDENKDFITAQDLHTILKTQKYDIGLSTVYRSLQIMVEDNIVDTIRNREGETMYRRCKTTSHHHHLICNNCSETIDITGEALENWIKDLSGKHQYFITGHTLDIFGICIKCQKYAKNI